MEIEKENSILQAIHSDMDPAGCIDCGSWKLAFGNEVRRVRLFQNLNFSSQLQFLLLCGKTGFDEH